jgi:WD40 repeat protein
MSTSTQAPLPAVLRSLQALIDEGVDVLPAGATAPTALPIGDDGTTYAMAQEAQWLDDRHFAVGRWDGSFSVFSWSDSTTSGSLITAAASDPMSEGVQMVCAVGTRSFATSCGDAQIAVWAAPDDSWRSLQATYYDYDASYGAANSAAVVKVPEADAWYLVVGHANGFATSWSYIPGDAPALAYAGSVDVRADAPVNPWDLHNVRSVQALKDNVVVTGSEDGYISILDLRTHSVVSHTVYNPAAQRGINSMALAADGALLVANCSVGPDDSNLWYFEIDSELHPKAVDHTNLKIDPNAPQAFNFYTTWARSSTGPCWFCSTQEGALWMGTAAANTIQTVGYRQATNPLGAALSYRTGRLVLAGHDLYEFRTGG